MIFSCNPKEYNTLNQYSNTPIKFAKRQIIDEKLDFKISIPKGYNTKIKEYKTEKNVFESVILSLDIKSKKDENGNQNWISIQKVRGHKKNVNLESAFNHSIYVVRDFIGVEILESGISSILEYDSFFLHTNPETEEYGKTDFIMFVLEADETDVFYNITATSTLNDNLKKNMSMLISCIRTFEKIEIQKKNNAQQGL